MVTSKRVVVTEASPASHPPVQAKKALSRWPEPTRGLAGCQSAIGHSRDTFARSIVQALRIALSIASFSRHPAFVVAPSAR